MVTNKVLKKVLHEVLKDQGLPINTRYVLNMPRPYGLMIVKNKQTKTKSSSKLVIKIVIMSVIIMPLLVLVNNVPDQTMQSNCNEQYSCTVKAHNDVFGDPCVGHKKVLYAKYNCNPSESRSAVSKRILKFGNDHTNLQSFTFGNDSDSFNLFLRNRNTHAFKHFDGKAEPGTIKKLRLRVIQMNDFSELLAGNIQS